MDVSEWTKRGNHHYQNDEFEEALFWYQKVLDVVNDIDVMSRVALIHFGEKHYDIAFRVFTEVLRINPSYASGFYGLGIVSEEMGKPDEAIEYYLETIKIDPGYATAHFFLANIYSDKREKEKAKHHYLKAIEVDPAFLWAHINLGALYEEDNQLEKALHHATIAYEIDPNTKYICFNLGVIHSKIGNMDFAVKCFLEENEKLDGNIYSYLNLGILYKEYYKNISMARSAYLEGLTKENMNPSLRYNMGCLDVLDGCFTEAKKQFELAFSCDGRLVSYFLQDEEVQSFRHSPEGVLLVEKFSKE